MIFMGTGAAQLIPSPFCECDYCKTVRLSDDKRNIRGRSGFQIDEKNLIDLGPDTQYTAGLYGVSFRKTENIFYTHCHTDHFSYANWENLHMCSEPVSLNAWLSEGAMAGMEKIASMLMNDPSREFDMNYHFIRDHITFHPVKLYETCRAGDMNVTALRANHPGQFKEETHGINWLFERNGKRFLYACDTGLWCDENYEFLKNTPLDIIVMDCTFGLLPRPRTDGHLNLEHFEEIIRRFEKKGIFTPDTLLYANHIGHQCGMLHAEFDAEMKVLFGPNASVSYDGLEIAPF